MTDRRSRGSGSFCILRSDRHGEEQLSAKYVEVEQAAAIRLVNGDFQMYNDVRPNRTNARIASRAERARGRRGYGDRGCQTLMI